MKYFNFIIKLVSLLAVAGALSLYQSKALEQEQLVWANQEAVAEVESYNAEVQAEKDAWEAELAAAKAALVADAETASEAEETAPEESALYVPGTYEASADGFGGAIYVRVTLSDNAIEAVEVLSHDGEDPAYYELAEALLAQIVSRQTADLDAVSGATFSSNGILNAAKEAIAAGGAK